MNPAIWAALIGLSGLVVVQALGLVIWGARLTQRVKTLEAEVEPLKQLAVQLAVMSTKLDGLLEQFKDMNASMRWLRQPADYQPPDLHRPGAR